MNTQMNFNCRLLKIQIRQRHDIASLIFNVPLFFAANFLARRRKKPAVSKDLAVNLYETGRSVFFIDTKITEK